MPDWLRENLKATLTGDELDRISRIYQWLTIEAKLNGRGNIGLPVSLPENADFRRSLRRWLHAERELSSRFDPLKDWVFAETLFGARARSLDFLLPRLLARQLGPRLRALVPRLTLGAVFATAVGWLAFQGWGYWGRGPVQDWLLAGQLRGHESVTVDLWHTKATAAYAEAMAQTLQKAKFRAVVEPRELAMPMPAETAGTTAETTRAQPVNAVQWGQDADEDAAMYVLRRLAYLAWGAVPNKVAPGADPPATGPGLDAPPKPGHLRVLLLMQAGDRTGFGFSDLLSGELDAAPPEVFRDCADCLEMVVLPGGSFLMGSPADESGRIADEGPQREVRVAPFAIGRNEVTFDEYDRFAEATGRAQPDDQGWGRSDQPAIKVSWNDPSTMRYRRAQIEGATYFFTVNLADRSSRLLIDSVGDLREVVRDVREAHPFEILAWVVLPDHLHAIWRLPHGDADYSMRWGLIKSGFSRRLPKGEKVNASRKNKGERGMACLRNRALIPFQAEPRLARGFLYGGPRRSPRNAKP